MSVDREDAPPVSVDEGAITLAVLNLVDNSVKYAADGQRLDVSVRPHNKRVALRVRDYGPGIPTEEHDRIFERFYRADAARHGRARGSGIGLALVKHIAEAHGGRVLVETPDGGGAAFTILLPVAPSAPSPDSRVAEPG